MEESKPSIVTNIFDPLEIFSLQCFHLLCTTVMLLIPNQTKREYMVAREAEPELVNTESPPINFLRTEGYNTLAACRRLAMYWKHRRAVFGEERWLKPMFQTGSGALSAGTIEVIRSGCIWHIVDPVALIIVDFSRFPIPVNENDGLEWLFYWAAIASNEKTQKDGYFVIHKIGEGQKLILVPGFEELLRDALPLGRANEFVVSTIPETKKILDEFLKEQISKQIKYNSNGSHRIVQHFSRLAQVEYLESTGIPRQSIPVWLGGNLENEFHHNWIRSRISIEEILGNTLRNKSLLSLNQSSALVFCRNQKASIVRSSKAGRKGLAAKRGNAIYHQRWLQKQHFKKNALEASFKLEKSHNAQLRATNQKLESLLAEARYLVALHNSE